MILLAKLIQKSFVRFSPEQLYSFVRWAIIILW